ncbi:MAG: trypsin-like peptidase domain-containing protein [Balneolaceae bacterium]
MSKRREHILWGVILLLTGVVIGMWFSGMPSSNEDHAEVRVTELTRARVTDGREYSGADDLSIRFDRIASEVTPSVVFIETTVQMDRRRDESSDSNENPGLWDRLMPQRARMAGSGVVLNEDGYILTNHHVIDAAVQNGIQVTLSDKRSYPARLVGSDPSTDLAVLRIDADQLKPIVMGDSDRIRIGEWVLAIGNPFRLRSTVTAGIVSALGRDVQIINDDLRIESFIQTDAAINRGNSGGALVNTRSELIGINTAIATQSGTYQGYGFAVPVNLAVKVARDLIEFGETRRGMLGVTIESVNHAIARDLGIDEIAGVMVAQVLPGSGASMAGLQRRDVVLQVNGQDVNEANQLQEKVALFRPGDMVELSVWRSGRKLRVDVTLQELERREESDVSEESTLPLEVPGIEEIHFKPGFSLLEHPDIEGGDRPMLYVSRVLPGSMAWNRGLRPDVQLTEVNGTPLGSLAHAASVIRRAISNQELLRLKIETPDGVSAHVIIETKE